MIDYERARAHMVDSQLRAGGVTNARILAAMSVLPRENFVTAARRDVAYVDDIHWLGAGRFMSAPATLGKLLQLAEISADDTVLDVGAATGYSTSVIARLSASVIGLEADASLAATAAVNLAALGLGNASIVTGSIDQFGAARFDVIMVQGALASVPDGYIEALREGGRLVVLIRTGAVSLAHVFVKTGQQATARAEFNAFLPLLFSDQANKEFVF